MSAVEIVHKVQCAMRRYFVDSETCDPLGGRMKTVEHRGGLLIPFDGFDNDCDVSVAFVNVMRIYRTDTFPVESSKPGCVQQRVVVVQIGAARCSMAMDDQGNPPSVERMEHEANVLLDDANRLFAAACRAVKECEEDDLTDDAIVGAWEPVGPEGNVVSGVLTITFLAAGK